MQRTISIIYVIISALLTVYVTVMELEPALTLINLMAPNPGDSYSLTGVFLITWLIFLIPFTLIMLLLKKMRSKPQETVNKDRTGIFVTRQKALQSAVIGIPVFINTKKVGVVDNGKTRFFDVEPGGFMLQIGKGKQATELLEFEIKDKDQLKFEFRLVEDGLFTKIELNKIE